MTNEKDIAVKHDQPIAAINPMQMVQMAVEQGADIDKLEKLMALQERWEANEARKAYFSAMADFKKNAPTLVKNAHVSYGTTNYDHATLDEVAGKIAAAMSPLGLSFKWATDQGEGGTIKVACVISHVMGHSESTPLQASADQSGGKNNIQAIGSTVSYLQRYTLLAATGLAVSGQDNDAVAPPQPVQRGTLKEGTPQYKNAVAAFKRDGNLDKVTARVDVPDDVASQIKTDAEKAE